MMLAKQVALNTGVRPIVGLGRPAPAIGAQRVSIPLRKRYGLFGYAISYQIMLVKN